MTGPVRADLDVLAGDTYVSRQWGVLIGGHPVDLTAAPWRVRAQIRRRRTDPDTLVPVTTRVTAPRTDGDTTVPSLIDVVIHAEDTRALAGVHAVWDLEISHPTRGPGGRAWVRTLVEGRVRGEWDVSRDDPT